MVWLNTGVWLNVYTTGGTPEGILFDIPDDISEEIDDCKTCELCGTIPDWVWPDIVCGPPTYTGVHCWFISPSTIKFYI